MSGLSPREVVEAASRLLEAQRGLEAVELYFSPDYIEHNQTVPGGNLEGFVKLLQDEGFAEPSGRQVEFHIHHVMSEGDYVFVHQHIGEPGKPVVVIMDLYKVAGGRIVEHWDVWQTPPEERANTRVEMY